LRELRNGMIDALLLARVSASFDRTRRRATAVRASMYTMAAATARRVTAVHGTHSSDCTLLQATAVHASIHARYNMFTTTTYMHMYNMHMYMST
jgi:hypothetical protein